MRVDEAVDLAREWVRECGSQLPGFMGAHLAGSINQLPRGAILADSTDIDIYYLVEDVTSFHQDKFFFRGAFFEAVPVSLENYTSAEQVLSSAYGAHNLAADSILADPQHILSPLHERVKAEYSQKRWVQARSANAQLMLHQFLTGMEEAPPVNERLGGLLLPVLFLGGLPTVASCRIPTVRKCLVRARDALQATGQPALATDLLRVLGSSEMSRDQVEVCLRRAVTAFDRGLEVYRTPFRFDYNLRPCARPYLMEGAEQMIQEGDHREAMFWIAVVHWTANTALQNDAPVTEREGWQTSYDQLQNDLQLADLAAYRMRAAFARTLAQELCIWADQFVERRSDSAAPCCESVFSSSADWTSPARAQADSSLPD